MIHPYMKFSARFFYLLCLLLMPLLGRGQENIPLGSWRTHFSYQGIYQLVVAGNRVYAASENGFFYIDKEENSLQELSGAQGLSGAGIERLAYHEASASLLIAYRNASLDILQGGKIYNIQALSDASLPGERRVNNILFHNSLAYIGTDYGISVVNLQARELQESFFNLGPEGESTEVFDLAILNDSLFAATESGLMANALQGANLANFSSWRRFAPEEIPGQGAIQMLAASESILYAGAEGDRLLSYTSGDWERTSFESRASFRSLHWEEKEQLLLILTEENLYTYDSRSGENTEINSPLIQSPFEAALDESGTLWIADGEEGLLNGSLNGPLQALVPPGPLADVPVKLYAAPNGNIVAIYGRYREDSFYPDARSGFSVFNKGTWQNYRPGVTVGVPNVRDFTDVVFNPENGRYYFSTRTNGLLEWDPATEEFRRFFAEMEGVSLMQTAAGTPVNTLAVDAAGQVWLTQENTNLPLHRFNPIENSWEGYFQGNSTIGNALEMLVLPDGAKWLRLPGSGGILVVNEESGTTRALGSATNEGGFSQDEVSAMVLDLEYQVWVGFEQGINYVVNPFSVLEGGSVNAALPVYDRRALLNAEEVTALAVDGGNRKWIGTPNGQWVFGDFGDTLYHRFTTENSPLPDNYIIDVAIQQESGEVFIATGKGIVSYRSGATAADFAHEASIKVFPNPVHPGYEGMVSISGLARDATVKITDISGRLVKELAAEGGTASWNLTDRQGRRPATGIYMIFSATPDGAETLVGKLAIIN
jgi:ligand-binding sensor domain-containing protein